jgi:hypothetical protein
MKNPFNRLKDEVDDFDILGYYALKSYSQLMKIYGNSDNPLDDVLTMDFTTFCKALPDIYVKSKESSLIAFSGLLERMQQYHHYQNEVLPTILKEIADRKAKETEILALKKAKKE